VTLCAAVLWILGGMTLYFLYLMKRLGGKDDSSDD
jgi:hypothetical protein